MDKEEIKVAWACREDIRQYLADAERWRELKEFNSFITWLEAVIYGG